MVSHESLYGSSLLGDSKVLSSIFSILLSNKRVLSLLTMFLLFIYHLTALSQSEWHSDDVAVDLTRELMSHSRVAYSLRSSM